MKKITLLNLFPVILLLLLGVNSFAATKTTTQSGNWSSSTTWGGTTAPVAGDNVIVDGGFALTIDIPNAACSSIQLGGSALGAGTGTLILSSGTHLTVSGVINIGPVNSNSTAGSVTMTSGGILSCTGIITGRLGTWTAGTGTVEFTATNTLPTDNKVIFNNLTMSGGTTTLSGNLDVLGNILINGSATLNGATNTLSVSGDWTNNGTFTGNTGTVSFLKNGNPTISGTGLNNFNLIRVNLGASINNTLEVLAAHFNAPDGFLTIINGTFKLSGSFTFASTFVVGPTYNIDPGTGFWINNPNVTVTAQAGGISVRGLLRLTAGTFNVGTGVDNSLVYVTGSAINIEGGELNIAGQFTRNNATATTSYTQSGGIVTVVGQGSTNPTFAGFDLGAVGSTFTMSNGTIVIRNATSAPFDYLNSSSVATVTGGTLQIGDAASGNAQVFRIQSARPIGNLLISNATAQAVKPIAQLASSGLSVVNNITLQSGTTLDAKGFNISLGGNWTSSGIFTSGGNTVTFDGTSQQIIATTGGETFDNLVINKAGGTFTLNSSVSVNNAFSLTQGTISIGSNTLLLDGSVTGGGTLTSSANGTVNYNQSSSGQSILPGNYGNLNFSNFDKTLASSGITGISGLFTPGSASGHTVTGSTIDFNGGSQNIPEFAYNNLTASGSGTKTGSGIITVNGNLTNHAGIVFSGSTTLDLAGTTHSNSGTISTSTLTVGSGATLTNNGIVSVSSALSGTGTFDQAANAVLNIGGIADITVLNASAAGNTVNYSGSGQTVLPVTYHNLSLTGSGTPVLTGVSAINGKFVLSGSVKPSAATGITILGDFTIGSGTSFNAGSFSHTLKGNFSNTGTFVAGTSTIILNGSNIQTISGAIFNNLSIANTVGVTMSADETINGTTTLTSGSLSIGAHTLTLNGLISVGSGSLTGGSASNISIGGAGASTTLPGITVNNLMLNRANGISLGGDITVNGALTVTNGTLNTSINKVILGASASLSEPSGQPVLGTVTTTRNITATSGTELFGNIGSDITLNGVAPGSTTVLRKTGLASTGSGHSSIHRYFDITPTTNTGLNTGLVFHYDATELNNQNGNILELYKSINNGTTWNNQGGVATASNGTISVTGINDFSRWTAADTSNTLGNTVIPAITLMSPAFKFVGDAGFTLTVTGSNFVNGKSTVRFKGVNKTTTFINSTQLSASVSAADLLVIGSFPVTVFNAGGGGLSNAIVFTVNPLPPSKILVETGADGSGTVVSEQTLASGSAIKVYAVSRDILNNFVANVAATTWVLENISGGIVSGDLVPAADGKSAVFTGHSVGTSDIKATSGILTSAPSGVITVIPGAASKIKVETAASGSGNIVPAQSLASGSALTVYSVSRDASDNFVANVAVTTWVLENISGGIVSGDLTPAADGKSAVFTGHVIGTSDIKATSGALTSTTSGVITVTQGAAAKIKVETAANGSGNIVPDQSLASGSALTVYSISRDASDNFVANVAATTWVFENISGGVVSSDLVPAADNKSAVFTGHIIGTSDIKATSGGLTSTPSGVLTVTQGAAAKIKVETAANGSGNIVSAQSLASGSELTVYSISRDASDNFVANVAATTWVLENISGGVVSGDLVPAADNKSAVFTGHITGTSNIKAKSGILTSTPSGVITVIAGAAAKVNVETTSDGNGSIVPAQLLSTGSQLTVYAITRDALNNFVANIAADVWSIQNVVGTIHSGDLVPAADKKSAVFMSHSEGSASISATSGALAKTTSGTITIFSATGIVEGNLQTTYALNQNYPNPFSQTTTISYQVPDQGKVVLKVYDMHGVEVATLVNQTVDAGQETVTFDAGNLSGGTYYYRLQAGKYTETKKLLLVR